MAVRYFEDYEIGRQISAGKHLVTSDEMLDFARRWDPQPFHTDERKGEQSVFRGLTASGAHIFAISVLLTHQFKPKPAVIASLGYDELRFPNPVRPGDRLSFHSECLKKRESRSKSDRGVIVFHDQVLNQRGQPVATMKSTIMIARRPPA